MSTWTDGYVSEIDYTHGYYRELAPSVLALALLNRGVRAKIGSDQRTPLRYLELGVGQGLSLNIHAAACPGEFWGTDFNPVHAANAMEMAQACNSGARIFDLSFAELAARDDLPEFDVIALHGIWSWISDESRSIIVELARRKLAVGGVFYISYNATPGWSPAMPLQHLMKLHADLVGSDTQDLSGKIDRAVSFAQKVVDSGARYFKANPTVAARVKTIQGQDRRYLAHEYFNRDWQPMPFSQVVERLSAAKLGFAASAYLLDHVDDVNLSAEGRQLLAGIDHSILRESVRDYLVNQQFRRDIFVKGARPISLAEQVDHYRHQVFTLTTPAADVAMKFAGQIGEVTLSEPLYRPLLEILAANDYAPKSVEHLLAHPAWKGQSLALLVQCLLVLAGASHVLPVQDAEAIKVAKPRCQRLNQYLCERARHGGDIGFLASPVTGAGIAVTRFNLLFLLARQEGHAQVSDWVAFAWEILKSQNQTILKDGKALATVDENIAELTRQAQVFAERQLPLLKALGIA